MSILETGTLEPNNDEPEICCANCCLPYETWLSITHDEYEPIPFKPNHWNNWYCSEDCYEEHTRNEG